MFCLCWKLTAANPDHLPCYTTHQRTSLRSQWRPSCLCPSQLRPSFIAPASRVRRVSAPASGGRHVCSRSLYPHRGRLVKMVMSQSWFWKAAVALPQMLVAATSNYIWWVEPGQKLAAPEIKIAVSRWWWSSTMFNTALWAPAPTTRTSWWPGSAV